MSKTVDERVVEMRFDNAQFEKNVQTSMSTLEKLKQKLNMSNASKGLENISSAAKKVDMSGLSTGIETVRTKFSALEVMGVTALANITNSAVNAGKRMVSALTINPIKDGFKEYETQMNAVQTILANTQSEGTNVKIVNKALDELNSYADKTIYNFTEMTRNIGTFTAAGVKLDTSVNAIKGISNLAAISGSTSQQASTAMYQLSQALAAGKVQLMDWNSVVNAGMGGKVFQDALIRTSQLLNTGAKASIAARGSFRESLRDGWLTAEVLTQTLDQFSTAAETEEEYAAAVKKFVDQGYTKEQAKEMADMARSAGQAATKVKTFTQLIDTLKEAIGSGWSRTWQIIIGDFEEAKELWSDVSDVLGGFVKKFSDARNKLLESALGKGFSSLSEKISNAIEPAEKAIGAINDTVDAVADLGGIVDDVILGKFGNGKSRFDKLTESGINYYKVQNKVNEKMGDSYRYMDEQIQAQDKLLGSQSKTIDGAKNETKETAKLTEEKKNLIKEVASMTEEQMRAKGYTDDQIDAFKELGATANKLGMPLNDFIDNMDKITGRWLLINSFKNIGNGIVKTFKAIGEAWRETFDPVSADTLFNIIAAFHKFSSKLNITDETADKLKRTFKGLFALLDIVKTIVGGGLNMAFKVLSAILGSFDMDILDLTAGLGDLIVKFRDFLFDNKLLNKGFELLGQGVKMVVDAFKDLYNSIKNLPNVQKFIESIKNMDLTEIGENIIEGLKNGLSNGLNIIPETLKEIGVNLLNAIKKVLGIHSPSKEMEYVGTNIIEGLINGIKNGAGKVWDVISNLGSDILTWFKNFDWSKAFAVGASAGIFIIAKNITDALGNLTAPLSGLGDLLSGAGEVLNKSAGKIKKILDNTAKVVKSFSKVLNAKAFEMKASAIKDLAISLAIMAGSVYLLAQLDAGKLWSAVGAVTVLGVVLGVLAFAMDKLTSASASIDGKKLNIKGMKTGLVSIGLSLILIAATVKIMGNMDPDQAKKGFIGLAGLIVAIGAVFLAFGTLVKGKSAQNIDKAGKMIRQLSVSLLLMVGVVKLISLLEWGEMGKGVVFISGFIGFVAALLAITKLSGKGLDKLGGMMLKVSASMLLMIAVVKLVGSLTWGEMGKGALFAGAFSLFILALISITKVAKDQEFAKLGGLLMSVTTAMLLMVGVIKLVNKLSIKEMLVGAAFVAAFVGFIAALVTVTKVGSEQQMAKVAGMILAMSVAIGILAGVCIILGLINLQDLAKGVVAVGILGGIMTAMILATKGANDVKGSIIAMAAAIGIMAASIAILSFIDPTKLIAPTLAMSMLIGMFSLLVKSSGTMTKAMGSLIIMTVALGVMATALYILAGLPIAQTLAASASLSTLLLTLSAVMKITSMIPISAAITGALGLASFIGIIAGLLLILGGLSKIPGVSEIISSGGETLAAIGYAIGKFVGSIIGGFGAGISSGLPEIGTNLSAFMINATPFLTGIKMVNESVLTGVGFLSGAILALTAADLIAGIASFISGGSSFASLGTELSRFMVNALPFIAGASTLNAEMMAGVKCLAETLLILTAADLISGISSWLTGGASLAEFGNQLIPFGAALAQFSSTVAGKVDESAVMAAANAGKIMAEMQKSIVPSGGVVQWFTGEKDMASFGAQLVSFGDAIVQFSNKVSEGINEEAVMAAANAGKIMTEMQKSIVPSGGVVQWFTGEKDMATFGTQLVSFGDAIVQFSNKVSEGVDETAITAAANAGKIMIEMQKSLVPSGGVVQWFTGQQNMATFGTQLVSFGDAIVQFSNKVSNGIDEAAVTSAANAGLIMTTLQKNIPEKHWLDGKVTLDDFGKNIASFGEGIKKYSEKVTGIDSGSVSNSLTAASDLVALTRKLSNLDTSKISNFEKVVDIGSTMQSYSSKVSSVNASDISASISAAKKLSDFIRSLSDFKSGGIESFKNAVQELAKVDLKAIKDTFTGSVSNFVSIGSDLSKAFSKGFKSNQSEIKSVAINTIDIIRKTMLSKSSTFTEVSKTLMNKFAKGISGQKSTVSKEVSSVLSSTVSGIRDYYSKFSSAGSYLVSGFASGISSNTYKATAKAKAMAKAAYEAAKDELDINSPSKVFRRLAYCIPEGFAQGIDRMGKVVENSSTNMAKNAIFGTENALTKIADLINGDIDAQPTIRPVLDLSDVRSGVGTLSGMFGNGSMIGIRANVNAINSLRTQNRQNGINADVVSAINKLNKSISSLERPSYTVNGITYDDGSNVSNAVESLVRAARIERRL